MVGKSCVNRDVSSRYSTSDAMLIEWPPTPIWAHNPPLAAISMTLATPPKNALALAAVCLTSLMFGLEISSVPTVLSTLEIVLHADFKEIQWIMNAYTLACTTVLMGTGALADRFGRKRIYVASVVMFGASAQTTEAIVKRTTPATKN